MVTAAAAERLTKALAMGMLKLTCSPVVRKSQPWSSILRLASPMPESTTESSVPTLRPVPLVIGYSPIMVARNSRCWAGVPKRISLDRARLR